MRGLSYIYIYIYIYIGHRPLLHFFFIRICFIALCNICMSENSSVELMFSPKPTLNKASCILYKINRLGLCLGWYGLLFPCS